jgi:iron complex transport system substrate-binding protein
VAGVRVVSLLPSATEIVHELGAGSTLVGRSEECDFPSSVRELPIVMRARTWDPERSSEEIDERVRRVRGGGESLYELDLDRLRTLAPELIFTQDLCTVCSVTDTEVVAACRATGIDPTIVTLGPLTLDEVWDSVEVVGVALGLEARSREVAGALRSRAVLPEREPNGAAPTVAIVEWLDPPIVAGLWTPDIVTAAGGTAVAADPGRPGHRTSWKALEETAPDLLVLSPCSFSVPRTRAELAASPVRAQLARLAPRLGIWLADEAYFSRPGPRLAAGVELVRALLDGRAPPAPMPAERWEP